MILDTGCTHHLVRSQCYISQFTPFTNDSPTHHKKIQLGSGDTIDVVGFGISQYLGKVLVVPDVMFHTVVSAGMLDSQGYTLTLSNGLFHITNKNNRIAMLGYKSPQNLYVIKTIYPQQLIHPLLAESTSSDKISPVCVMITNSSDNINPISVSISLISNSPVDVTSTPVDSSIITHLDNVSSPNTSC